MKRQPVFLFLSFLSFLFFCFFSLVFRRACVESSLPFSSDPLETIAKTRRAIAPLLGNALRNRCRAIAPAIHLAYDDYNGDYSWPGFHLRRAHAPQGKSLMRIPFVCAPRLANSFLMIHAMVAHTSTELAYDFTFRTRIMQHVLISLQRV